MSDFKVLAMQRRIIMAAFADDKEDDKKIFQIKW